MVIILIPRKQNKMIGNWFQLKIPKNLNFDEDKMKLEFDYTC